MSSRQDFDEFITISKFQDFVKQYGPERSMNMIRNSFPDLYGALDYYFTNKKPVKTPALLKDVTKS